MAHWCHLYSSPHSFLYSIVFRCIMYPYWTPEDSVSKAFKVIVYIFNEGKKTSFKVEVNGQWVIEIFHILPFKNVCRGVGLLFIPDHSPTPLLTIISPCFLSKHPSFGLSGALALWLERGGLLISLPPSWPTFRVNDSYCGEDALPSHCPAHHSAPPSVAELVTGGTPHGFSRPGSAESPD